MRSRISTYVLRLYDQRPEEMWDLIEGLAHDKSTQVRKSIVLALGQLARAHPARTLQLISEILERSDAAQPGADELRRLAVQNLTEYYVWRGDKTAHTSILRLVSGLPETHREAANMTFALRHGMMAKPIEGRSETEARATRERSVEIFTLVIDKVTNAFGLLIKKLSAKQNLDADEGERFQSMKSLASSLSQELYLQ